MSVSPTVVGLDDTNGFTLSVTDSNESGVSYDSYTLSGIPDGWSVYDGSTLLSPTSPDPVIYEVGKTSMLAGKVRVVAPADYTGTLSGVTVSRLSLSPNLVTDFDNGTFDYLGTAKPELSSDNTQYVYHDPTTLTGAGTDTGSECGLPQYGPCDGYYSIWPTAEINGPEKHYNNYWADLRSVDNAMVTPDTETVCTDAHTSGQWGVNTLQITDEQSAASGKFLIINGANDVDPPNNLLTTTITGLQPHTLYSFAGDLANLSFHPGVNILPVKAAFYLTTSEDAEGTVFGSSTPMSRQSDCETQDTVWTESTGLFDTGDATEVTIAVRNYADGGLGDDLAIDNLALYPMTQASVDLTVGASSVVWAKTDAADGAALAGSQWSLVAPDGSADTVVDNGENDADPAVGALRVDDLAWGDYTLTETQAPDGYVLDPVAHTFTADAENAVVDLGAITNTATVTPTPTPSPVDPGAAVNTGGTIASGPGSWPFVAGALAVGLLALAAAARFATQRRRRDS